MGWKLYVVFLADSALIVLGDKTQDYGFMCYTCCFTRRQDLYVVFSLHPRH